MTTTNQHATRALLEDELDEERDAEACVGAAELTTRATYAGPCEVSP